MNKTIFILILFISNLCVGQNLVPNPSFEQFSMCPDDWNQFNRVDNWSAYKETPDYFNSCNSDNTYSAPHNLMGYQTPYSGNAYSGLIFYEKGGESLNEMIGTQLIQALVTGTKYYVSLRVVLKYDNSFGICCGQNKIGVRFSNQSYSVSSPPLVNNSAHIFSNTIISDTSNWIQIFGEFIADSSYNYISVGNFFNNINVSVNDIIPTNFSSYYFVDDICVSTDSTFTANYITTGIEPTPNDEIISIYPNPATNNIKVISANKPIKIALFNTIGQQIILLQNITNAITDIDISDLSSGVFFIVVESQNNSLTKKLLKL